MGENLLNMGNISNGDINNRILSQLTLSQRAEQDSIAQKTVYKQKQMGIKFLTSLMRKELR